MLKVVLDTNVLLVSIPKKSKYRPIFEALINHKFELLVCNELLYEYYEIIARKTTQNIATNLVNLLMTLPNVSKHEIFYKWNLITVDYDDNKFVDCAISAQADFIVSNDNHFNVLQRIDFPTVKVISADEFLEISKDL